MSSCVELNILKVIGVISIIYWLSFVVYLPPITPYPDLDSFVEKTQSAKETLGTAYPARVDLPREDLKREIVMETNLMYAAYIVPMVFGLISGVLIYRKKRLGQVIAIVLSAILIFWTLKSVIGMYPNILMKYKLMLSYFPDKIIHEQIVGSIFYVTSLVLLASPAVSKQFKNKAT